MDTIKGFNLRRQSSKEAVKTRTVKDKKPRRAREKRSVYMVTPTRASSYMENRNRERSKSPVFNRSRDLNGYSRDKSRNQRSRTPVKTKSSFFNKNLLCNKFLHIPCSASTEHGSYDFICLDPAENVQRLICMDCMKSDPKWLARFKNRSEYFVRIHKFLELCSVENLTFEQNKKIEEIQSFQSGFDMVLGRFDKEQEKKINDLKIFFKEKEEIIVQVVRRKIRGVFLQLVDDFMVKWSNVKMKMNDLNEKIKTITKFVNGSHLAEIEALVDNAKTNPRYLNKLEKEMDNIINFRVDLSSLIDSWSHRIKTLSQGRLEKELMPQLDLSSLSKIFKEKEIMIGDDIDSIIAERDDFEAQRLKRFVNESKSFRKKNVEIFLEGFIRGGNQAQEMTTERLVNHSLLNKKSQSNSPVISKITHTPSPEKPRWGGSIERNSQEMNMKQTKKQTKIALRNFESTFEGKFSQKNNLNSSSKKANRDTSRSALSSRSFFDPIHTSRLEEIDNRINKLFGIHSSQQKAPAVRPPSMKSATDTDPMKEIKRMKAIAEEE